MINPVKSFLTHGPLKLKEIYTNSSMASGWSHEGLFSCRHCNFAARLSLRILKIMPGLLLILIQGAKKVSFTACHSGIGCR